jgi:transcriptional regulator with GAF, ATPase, and Fis domain
VLHLGPEVVIEELGSRNGTRLGGHDLARGERRVVSPGEAIELGSVLMVLQGGRSSSATRETSDNPRREPDLGLDPTMKTLLQVVDNIARGKINVLLLGETGVGKEIIAERLHRHSPRSSKPLVKLNCAAFTEGLLESELFGYERGAFTGAITAKRGLIESADRGTLLLDEVGELPPVLQAKLLRAIEQGEVQPLGAVRPRAVDVRFISATNRALDGEVAAGRFRQDLYFRLSGTTIAIPPLRERRTEIEPLARLFVGNACRQIGRSDEPTLAPETLARMNRYGWPGNVRELRNAVERAILVCGEEPTILPEHLPDAVGGHEPAPEGTSNESPFRSAVRAYEREQVIAVLKQCNGNQTEAARLLGLSRRALVARLSTYGMTRRRPHEQ